MRLFLMAMICLNGSLLFASNFDGVWTGIGKFHSSSLGEYNNATAVLELKEVNNTLVTEECWSFLKDGANWRICSSSDLEIQGSSLFYKGLQVGSISDNKIEISYVWDGTTTALLEFQSDGSLNLQHDSVDSSGRFVKRVAIGMTR
jgi:hypothetical protein